MAWNDRRYVLGEVRYLQLVDVGNGRPPVAHEGSQAVEGEHGARYAFDSMVAKGYKVWRPQYYFRGRLVKALND